MAPLQPFLILLSCFFLVSEAQQIQMPEASALLEPDQEESVRALQKNVSEIWSYIRQLRGAITGHFNHLRQHQDELESSLHRLEHMHEGQDGTHSSYTDDHHHHSGEQHSGDHHHSGEDHHSHTDDHSHDHHSEGDHSHSEHSHSGDDHSHSSHSHTGDDHSHSGDDHSHGSDGHHDHHTGEHKDSHENEDDLQQQSEKETDLLPEPLVVAVQRPKHDHSLPVPPSGGSTLSPMTREDRLHHHHYTYHHHHSPSSIKNRTRLVSIPKYSESDLYSFAVCNMQPNRAIAVESQQEITGKISLWQKKMGGPLNIHVHLQGFQMGDHHSHHQQSIQTEEEDNDTPAVGHRHGFHVHTSADMSNGCQSTGPHYNPKGVNHGGPNSLIRHVGDLGNIECDDHGTANIVFSDDIASLKGPYSIIGKPMVIHTNEDDLGLGSNDESLKTGNAGVRVACCIIEKVEKLNIRTHKAMKIAKQYKNY